MKKSAKSIFSILLSLVMLLSAFPFAVSAIEMQNELLDNDAIFIEGNGNVTINNVTVETGKKESKSQKTSVAKYYSSAAVGSSAVYGIAPIDETPVLVGDINGDGTVSVTDMLMIKAHLLDKSKIPADKLDVADMNGDGIISITDFVQNKAVILNIPIAKPFAITKQPVSTTVAKGESATVTVLAQGDDLVYKWYYKDLDDKMFTLADDVKGNTYSCEMAENVNGRQVYCIVSDRRGAAEMTDVVTLSMIAEITVTNQPVSVEVQKGEIATVTVIASGEELSFKWYYKDLGDSDFIPCQDNTTNEYTVEMSESVNGRRVYCIITDKYGNEVKTATATLSMRESIEIINQPTSVYGEAGQMASVSVVATGAELKYNWYYKDTNQNAFTLAKEFTSNSYSVQMSNAISGRRVYCVITDKYGNAVTTVTVSLRTQPVYFITVDNGVGDNTVVGVSPDGEYTLKTPTIKGYSFVGWKDSEGHVFPSSGTVGKDTKVYAVWNIDGTDTLQELVDRTNAGVRDIIITSNITVNKPIFISYDTNIYADKNVTLTRDPSYDGDIFVVGQDKNGVAAVLNHRKVHFNLGGGKGTLTIDGNRSNLKVKVVGSALFVSDSSEVNIYNGLEINNNLKLGNRRVLECEEFASIKAIERAGGAAILVANGTVNMYGGALKNNEVLTEKITVTTESGSYIKENDGCGGAVYNRGDFNMYGGIISNSKALTGGAIYNDRILNIEGGTITDSRAETYGGAICSSSSSLSEMFIGNTKGEEWVIIQNSSSEKAGGAVYSNTSSPIVVFGYTKFINNRSNSIGGAIYTGGGLTIYDSEFIGNYGTWGGAICHKFSNPNYDRRDLMIVNTIFTDNTSPYGGAICLDASANEENLGTVATIIGCTFENNAATNEDGTKGIGGAIYASNNTEATITDCTFIGNSSIESAGALHVHGGAVVDLTNSYFENNKAVYGGAINISGAVCNIKDIVADGNEANYGGAMYVKNTTATFENVRINRNRANAHGGAMYLDGATLELVGNVEFVGNSAKLHAGAIYLTSGTSSSKLTLEGGLFDQNSSIVGGAISIRANCEASFRGTSFSNNNDTAGTSEGGGAISVIDGKLSLEGVTFENNTSGAYGGAVRVSGSDLVMNGITAIGNTAKGGGVVYITNGDLEVKNCNFTENTASWGGAISVSKGNLTVTDGKLANNSASSGGAIYANPCEITVKNVTFEGNEGEYGGAVCLNGAVMTVSGNTTFKNNTATVRSGAIDVTVDGETRGQLIMTDGCFEGNSAPIGGAAGARTGCKLTFTDTEFKNNSSTDTNASNDKTIGGGAIYAHANAVVTLSGVTMTGNTSKNYGGAVMLNGGKLTVKDNSVISGSSANTGAAIYLYSCTQMDISDLVISDTSARWNGAVYSNAGTLTVNNVTATNNTADKGTVFYISGGTATLENVTATSNTAANNGGVVHVGAGTVEIKNMTATKNKAKYGGVIYAEGGNVTVTGGSFTENTSVESGGVIAAMGGTVTVNGSQINKNTANKGGAIYIEKGAHTASSLTANENSAPNGGAIYIKGDTAALTLTNCTLNSNTTTGNGGAINVTKGVLKVEGGELKQNSAGANSGGAIVAYAGSVELKNVTLEGNTAGYGGAVSINGVTLTANNATFKNNIATVRGGACDFTTVGEVTGNLKATGGLFESNEAPYGGAVAVRNYCTTEFIGTELKNNKSTDLNASNSKTVGGGAIYGHTYSKVILSGAKLDGNTSKKYGGAVMVNGGTLTVKDNTVITNSVADTHGAAMYLYGATTTVTDATLSDNEAVWQGTVYIASSGTARFENVLAERNKANQGGVFCLCDSITVELKNVTAKGNTAKAEGGVIYHYAWGGKLDITDCNFTENTAATKGGALWAGAKSPVTISGGTFKSNSAVRGGAIYADTSVMGGNPSAAKVTVQNGTVFDSNIASGGEGGAIMIADGTSAGTYATTLIMTGAVLKNNKSYDRGGALATDASSKNLVIKVTDCEFIANESGYNNSGNPGGGAVVIQNGNAYSNGDPAEMKIAFTNCTFTDNLGDGTGGAIDIRSASYVKFDGLTATGNKSVPKWNGAVIYVTSEYSRLYLGGEITVSNNTAGNADSFIYVANAKAGFYTTHSSTADWVSLIYSLATVKYGQADLPQ